jgi:hypothetical protein
MSSNLILPPSYRPSVSSARWGRDNRPQRNEAREATVREWLKAMDSLLDVRWFEDLAMYGIVVEWPSNDPRRALIQTGEIGNTPFDILMWAAEDPHNGNTMSLPIDEIENKILEVLASADNQRMPWKARLKQIAEKNVEVRRKRKADFIENQVHDIASYDRNAALGIHQVNVSTEIK